MQRFLGLGLLLAALVLPTAALAEPTYFVTITNLTEGQTFTPILVAAHGPDVRLFRAGLPADLPLEILAEAGMTAPLTASLLEETEGEADLNTIPGMLGPGQTAELEFDARPTQRQISFAAMLIPTNDTFFAVQGLTLPKNGVASAMALAYDAGTEKNDQTCVNIPGPRCGGAGHSPGPNPGDEGHVHVSNGFHDLGDMDADGNEVLGPFTYDWRNPVARVTVRRVR